MNKMGDFTIEREIVIDAPIEVVWRTITEPDRITAWFADRVALDLRPGGEGTFVFEEKARTRPTTAPLLVETVDPPRRFSFRWAHPEGEAPVAGNSVLVEFSLVAEAAERTRLRVSETGVDRLGWPDDDKRRYVDDHRGGWAFHFGRLGALFPTPAG